MRAVFIYLQVYFYLVFSIGIHAYKHFCGQEFAAFSLNQPLEKCCACPVSSAKDEKPPCCDDQYAPLQLSDEQQSLPIFQLATFSLKTFDEKALPTAFHFYQYFLANSASAHHKRSLAYADSSPPWLGQGVDLYIRFEQYRL